MSRDKRREGQQRTEKKPMNIWSEMGREGGSRREKKKIQWQELKIINEGLKNGCYRWNVKVQEKSREVESWGVKRRGEKIIYFLSNGIENGVKFA